MLVAIHRILTPQSLFTDSASLAFCKLRLLVHNLPGYTSPSSGAIAPTLNTVNVSNKQSVSRN